MDEAQTLRQKKIAFAQSEHVSTVIAILQESCGTNKLVGESEYQTVVNAVTLDAKSTLITDFISALDEIKNSNFNIQ